MRKRFAAMIAATIVAGAAVGTAFAAGGPPPPKTYGGAHVAPYATGLMNPTSFAWVKGTMFAGDSGNSQGVPNGGVYVIKGGTATKLTSNVLFVGGMQFHKGALYLSVGDLGKSGPQFQILAWSGWNGTKFTHRKAIYTAPKGFQGFNGLAFGPDGRIYVGADLGLLNHNDHGSAKSSPYVYDILSMKANGKDLRVFAKGIRQAWQLAFAGKTLFAGDLGQDCSGANPCPQNAAPASPPDFLLKVKQGDNYGFPKCNWAKKSKCKGYTKPYKFFSAHMDPMGLAVIGKTLYIGSFLGAGGNSGGALYAMPTKGGKVKPVVTGFPLATDALAAHGGYLYVGGSGQTGGGAIYRVKP